MAVPEQTPYIEHTGNGATTSFALKFQCESKDHLIVLVDEIEPPIETWSLTGGNVVFTTAPASGSKIKLQRNTPFGRTTDYQSFNNSFRPQSVNGDFDRIWLKLQELGVADWLLKLYVDRLHQQQEEKINDLKVYVDDRDDELRAYLMEEIRKQGVALDQLDEYYNYLMQRLAQIAVDKGWDASFVVTASGETQQEVNDYNGAKWRNKAGGYALGATVKLADGDVVKSTVNGNTNNPNVNMSGWLVINNSLTVNTVADMIAIESPEKWAKVYVRSYNAPNYALANPFRGGGLFCYSPSKSSVNDGGIVINGWIRQFGQKSVLVDWFGADGVDDTLAIQRAINYSGASPVNLEVHFASYIYPVYDEITAESANRRNLTLVGTHNGYAGSLAYDFRNTNAGSVILSYAEGASTLFNINDGRYNNGQVHVKKLAIVGNYWDFQNLTTGTTAFKIAKADAAHPDDTWYKVNYLFEQVSFLNCFYPIKFTSPLTAPEHTMAKNFIGDTLLSRCSAYGCGYYFVAENTSFNRLTVRDNFLFGLTRQAFATKTLDGLNPASPEYLQQLIRMKIENTHFEGVRGMFNFMNLVGDFEDSRSSVEISNVTREASSLYENGTGTALGLVKDIDFIISGRFEDIGWNEQTGLVLGEGCTIQSMFNLNPLLPDAFSSKSPTTINCAIDSNTHTVATGSTKTLTFISYNTFDFVDMDFVVNFKAPDGSGLGMKKYVVSGTTATTASQTLAESGGISYTGLSVTASLSGLPEYILTLVVENTSAAAVTVETKLVRNVFGNKLYAYAS